MICSVDIRYRLVVLKISLLKLFLTLFKRVCLGVWKFEQWRKKYVIVSVSLPQSHNGFRVSMAET